MATTYPTDVSALIVVDLLNDFLHESGKANPALKEQIAEVKLIENLTRLLKGAREAGLQIVYAPHGLYDHRYDDLKYPPVRMKGAMERHVFWEGSHGADFFEPLKPQEGDIIVSRHRAFNAFNGTDLNERLKKRGIEKVAMAGLTSSTCIDSTGRHASESGYHLTFLKDAVADFTAEAHKAAVDVSYPTFGYEVLTVDEFLKAIQKS